MYLEAWNILEFKGISSIFISDKTFNKTVDVRNELTSIPWFHKACTWPQQVSSFVVRITIQPTRPRIRWFWLLRSSTCRHVWRKSEWQGKAIGINDEKLCLYRSARCTMPRQRLKVLAGLGKRSEKWLPASLISRKSHSCLCFGKLFASHQPTATKRN